MAIDTMISIVIPTYNRASKICRVLSSILAQSYSDWECLIVDDFSTDNTKEAVSIYQRKDSRIHYILNTRKIGAQGARNTGIINAKGTWIALFDSDDYMYPNFLESLVSLVTGSIDVVTSCAVFKDNATGKILDKIDWRASGNITRSLLRGESYVNYNGTLIRKDALMSIGLLDENCPSHQEFDTHLRLSKQCLYTSTDKILSEYYIGGEDTISASKEKYLSGWTYILYKHRWLWRRKEYRSFIVRARKLWDYSINLSSSRKYRWKLLSFVPEVILLVIKRKIWK